MIKNTSLLTSAALALLMSSTAHAATPVSMEEMQKQIEMLTQQVQKLSSVVEEQGKVISAQKTAMKAQDDKVTAQAKTIDKVAAMKMAAVAPAAGDNADGVKVSMAPGPKIESADGKYSAQLFGRVHMDANIFDDDKSDRPDSANIRRARLGLKGNLGQDFNYKAEFDFGEEAANIKEAYLSYTGFKFGEVLVGNFKPPVGLEQNTSSNYMSFMEPSPASSAFTRDEIIGAGIKTGNDNWSFATGIFNEDPGVNNTTAAADDESWSLDARASTDLLRDSPNVLHVGLGGSYRTTNEVTGAVTLSGKPVRGGNNMVTTGAIANVDHSFIYGAELAGIFGPVSFQGEYFHDSLDVDGGADAAFDGWYLQGSFLLTGETKPYKGKTGNFDRIKPKRPINDGGYGAVELLARYDRLDLNDASAGITGGELSDLTFGVNWYLTDYVRLMTNYTIANTDDEGVVADDGPSILSLRAQWDF